MYIPEEHEELALTLLAREKKAWEAGDVTVADAVKFSMRDEIDDARKNYYGKFDVPKDSDTGMDKLFVPLTEWTVETVVKNIDLDLKDIRIKAPEGKKKAVATTAKLIILHFLKRMGFGESMNDIIRRMCIDGTAIIKVTEEYNPEFKRNMPKIRIVDPLNLIVDPSASCLQDVPVIERAVMTIDEIERHTDWTNKEHIQYSKDSVPITAIYERWGKIPLSLITKKKEDEMKWVEGVITASMAIRSDPQFRVTSQSEGDSDRDTGTMILHKIARNTNQFKPYEEAWLKRVPSRWHGRGIPEQLKALQTWLNTVVNIRRDEALNKLTGKYKIRKGSGITRQMLQNLRAGGAIVVDEMDDIQELVERDIRSSAFEEPAQVLQMADRVTGSFDIARGEGLPASLPATTAVLQEKGSRSTFALIQENTGMFLERLLQRHLIPMIMKEIKEGEVLRITGELEDLEVIDEAVINHFINELRLAKKQRKEPRMTFFEERRIRKDAEKKFQQLGKDRFSRIKKMVFDPYYDAEVYITDEKMDPAVLVRQLNDLLFQYSNIPGANLDVNALMKEVLDVMGLSGTRFIRPQSAQPQVAQNPAALGKEAPTAQGNFERAAVSGTLSPAER